MSVCFPKHTYVDQIDLSTADAESARRARSTEVSRGSGGGAEVIFARQTSGPHRHLWAPGQAGKVHGSLARAGKVKSQTPKVEPQEKKKQPKGRAWKRHLYNARFVNATTQPGGKPAQRNKQPQGKSG
ncbi:hypothetical protein BMF94_0270 [Rhodotorula taiwanensis]|uniref:Uncharacterized protein n=1 Tax=Rhodotorula taiwanensis TaxID=741276 RepID=A0A2S5BIS2_9BASI|nr:hypothetical protein BMF94_0270 [Rhodotorula taiwanensis]